MTKKHFIALADHIRSHNSRKREPFTSLHLATLMDFCHQQNPRFDAGRWLAYLVGECNPNGGRRRGVGSYVGFRELPSEPAQGWCWRCGKPVNSSDNFKCMSCV